MALEQGSESPISTAEEGHGDTHDRHERFVFFVDGVEYVWPKPTISGAEIMEAAGIPPSEGLVELLPDGSQKTVTPDETFNLDVDPRFKKRPRFKRG